MDSTKTTEEKTKRPRGRPRKIDSGIVTSVPKAETEGVAKAADERLEAKVEKEQKTRQKPGPELFSIDWEWVDQMCVIDATAEEIAACYRNPETNRMGIHPNTLVKACKRDHGVRLCDYLSEKRQIGKASLRRRQHQAAMDGNPALLIWLGKQRLGQTDKQEIAHDNAASGKLIVNLTTDKPG